MRRSFLAERLAVDARRLAGPRAIDYRAVLADLRRRRDDVDASIARVEAMRAARRPQKSAPAEKVDPLAAVCDRRSPRALRELAGLRAAVRRASGKDGRNPASRAARRALREVAGEAVPPDPDVGSSALRPAALAYGGVVEQLIVPDDREAAERLREIRFGRSELEGLEDVALLGQLLPSVVESEVATATSRRTVNRLARARRNRRVVDLYRSGLGVEDVALAVGVKSWTVYYVLRRAGVSLRGKGNAHVEETS